MQTSKVTKSRRLQLARLFALPGQSGIGNKAPGLSQQIPGPRQQKPGALRRVVIIQLNEFQDVLDPGVSSVASTIAVRPHSPELRPQRERVFEQLQDMHHVAAGLCATELLLDMAEADFSRAGPHPVLVPPRERLDEHQRVWARKPFIEPRKPRPWFGFAGLRLARQKVRARSGWEPPLVSEEREALRAGQACPRHGLRLSAAPDGAHASDVAGLLGS